MKRCLFITLGLACTVAACATPPPDTIQGRPPRQEQPLATKKPVYVKTSDSRKHPKNIERYEHEVLNVFNRNRYQIDLCKKYVAVKHERGIYLRLNLTLADDGELRSVEGSTQNTTRDQRAISCVQNFVRKWAFPSHPDSEDGTHDITINLKR